MSFTGDFVSLTYEKPTGNTLTANMNVLHVFNYVLSFFVIACRPSLAAGMSTSTVLAERREEARSWRQYCPSTAQEGITLRRQ